MAVVLGLMVLLGIMIAIVFQMVRQNNALVSRGAQEAQDILLGKSGLSYGLARFDRDPDLVSGWNADNWLKPDSLGFRVRLGMHGLFVRLFVTPLGRAQPRMVTRGDVARSWISTRVPSLVLWGTGDVVVGVRGGLGGDVYIRGLPRAETGLLADHRTLGDTSQVPRWLASGPDLDVIARWQEVIASVFSNRDHSVEGSAVRSSGSQGFAGSASLGSGVWLWDGPGVLDSLTCDGCILLAKELEIRRGVRLRDGLIWVARNFVLHGRLEGDGQILSRDTLVLDSVTACDSGIVLAALGRERETQGLPGSTSLVRLGRSRGQGMVVAFQIGAEPKESRIVLESDSLTRWQGVVLADGLVHWKGRLEGTLLAEQLLGYRADGVLQGGFLPGVLVASTGRLRMALPWMGHQSGQTTLWDWFHETQIR